MILLTGATGFIGKHLLAKLVTIYGKSNVLALSSEPFVDTNFLLHNGYNFNPNFFVEAGYGHIETIIHAGAFTPKASNEANQIVNCDKNISNTERLIYADFPSLKRIIFISTLDVYKSTDKIISEETSIEPATLYGISKWYGERMIEIRAKELGIDYQILRVGHVYGPGEEKYRKIIPVSLSKLLKNQPLVLYGTGQELRSFIYIDDVIDAMVNSINLSEPAGPINLVSKNAITTYDLLVKLKEITNISAPIQFEKQEVLGKNFTFNSSKMNTLLLKRPETKLLDGLKSEFEYMKDLL